MSPVVFEVEPEAEHLRKRAQRYFLPSAVGFLVIGLLAVCLFLRGDEGLGGILAVLAVAMAIMALSELHQYVRNRSDEARAPYPHGLRLTDGELQFLWAEEVARTFPLQEIDDAELLQEQLVVWLKKSGRRRFRSKRRLSIAHLDRRKVKLLVGALWLAIDAVRQREEEKQAGDEQPKDEGPRRNGFLQP